MKTGIRSATMMSLNVWTFFKFKHKGPIERVKFLGTILRYALVAPSTKKRIPMDVKALADNWVEAIVGMVTAHTKDEYDAHDAQSDTLLSPLMTAPVKQIRQFYTVLLDQLKADKRVPMLVWMAYEAWGAVAIKDAPDEGIRRLKKKLAEEIADLVEEPIRDQIPNAIKRALMWRDPEVLKEVKESLQSGTKPKLRGRESCLFLEGGKGKKKFSVML